MVARARTATQKVNDMLSGVTGKTSLDDFIRIEEKVMTLDEAAAEASAEQVKGGLLLSGTNKGGTEMQFRLLEKSNAVDKDLIKLKQTMALPEQANVRTSDVKATTHVLFN